MLDAVSFALFPQKCREKGSLRGLVTVIHQGIFIALLVYEYITIKIEALYQINSFESFRQPFY